MANARLRNKENLDVWIEPGRGRHHAQNDRINLHIRAVRAGGARNGSRANAAPQTAIPRVIEESAKKYEFSPVEIRVKKEERVELKVRSEDDKHGIKINVYSEGAKDEATPGLLFDHPETNGTVEKNVDQALDFVAAEPGSYDFKCAKLCGMGHGHMQGKLIVEP